MMINNVLNSTFDLKTSVAQAVSAQPQVLTDKLNEIAPEMVQELLNHFDDKKVEQLLHQELASLIPISSEPITSDYNYSDRELALRTVITNQQEGLLNNENSDELMLRLNKSVKDIQGAYANTSDILASLGQLGHEQKSFLASSEQHVERALGSYIEGLNRKDNEDDDNYNFELSVKTKEGDTVNITFTSSQGYDENNGEAIDGFALSYQVEGDLSEAEQQALTEVLSGVGEMADEFFKVSQNSFSKYVPAGQSDFNVDFLADFNNQQLSGFDVSFSTTDNQNFGSSSENNLNLSYNIDEKSHQQTLVFESIAGINEMDFSLDMSTFGGKDAKQMQQYITALDNNLEDSRSNSKGDSKTSAFGKQDDLKMQQGFALFKGAFSSMSSTAQRYSNIESVASQQFTDGRGMVADLVDNMITKDPRYKGLDSDTNNTLGDGISKLADFNAAFSFAKEPQGRNLRPQIDVNLEQSTQQHKSGKLTGVTQNKTVSTHFDYQLTRPDYYDKTESYDIGTAVKDNNLVGLDQKHKVDVSKEEYAFDPNTNQYELQMAFNEEIKNESNIRLVNDIWLENTESSHTADKKERVANEGEPEDFTRTHHNSHKKLMTLIGDLDELKNNKHVKHEYVVGLSNVNFFMDSNTK